MSKGTTNRARADRGSRVHLSDDRLRFDGGFSISLQRTLRVPHTGEFPLPPGLGPFPIVRLRRARAAVPAAWRRAPQFAIPMHLREALWIGLQATEASPRAVQIAAGGVNVVSGEPWTDRLSAQPQNYVVVPDQPWLDGFNSGANAIRQFVAAPLGRGWTAEEEMTGGHTGGLFFAIFHRRANARPRPRRVHNEHRMSSMGLGAGGWIQQKVYRDPFGGEGWTQRPRARVVVHLWTSAEFEARTGRRAPATPVSAETYARHGLPWFALFDEQQGSVPAPGALAGLAGVPEQPGAGSRPSPDALPTITLTAKRRKENRHG